MIDNLTIHNYKCLEEEAFHFKKLNILTGVNSSGKSSVLQSILLMSDRFDEKKSFLEERYQDFNTIKNRYLNAKEVSIDLDGNSLQITRDQIKTHATKEKSSHFNLDQELFYIAENRLGPEELAQFSSEAKLGKSGEFIFSLYEHNKSTPIESDLIKTKSKTLASNVDFWLSTIFDAKIELKTQKITADHIKVSYQFDKLDSISPFNLGAGVSYVAKILIVCLGIKAGSTVMIENPEIHIHPKAQARLGEFFVFASTQGVQLILETHCENLIDRVRYEVFQQRLTPEEVTLYYKSSAREAFQHFSIDHNGDFNDSSGKVTRFPSGFFDSSLNELLEMG